MIVDTPAGPLPAVLLPKTFQGTPLSAPPAPGDLVVVRSRGHYRVVKVERVGPKRAHVAYTTPGSVKEAQQREADRGWGEVHACKARREANLRDAVRYRRIAAEIERLGIATTEDVRESVPAMTVPEPLRGMLQAGGRNHANTVVVWPPAVWLEYARSIEEDQLAGHEESLVRARARDALTPAERIAQDVHVTRYEAPLAQVYEYEPASWEQAPPVEDLPPAEPSGRPDPAQVRNEQSM